MIFSTPARGSNIVGILSLALVFFATPAESSAQAATENKHARQGFWLTLGGGGGSLGCDECGDTRENGGTGQFALGGTISPRFQVGASSNVWTKNVEGVTVTMSSLTAIAKFYPSATGGFHLTGGLGLGQLEFKEGSDSLKEDGTSAILGLGYDIRVAKNFSITPFLNGIGGSFDGSSANFNQFGISLTWH